MKKINVKQLIFIIIPIFLELLLQILAGNVDKIMVQNDNLATSINQANSILDLLVVSISVLATASLILINQYKGAKNKEKETLIYKLSFYFNLFVGVILSILLFLLAKPSLNLLQVSDSLISDSTMYLKICGGTLFLQALMMSLQSFLRSNEYMKTSLAISIIFNVINVILNALFLYVFKINPILAVALGSVISRFIGVIILIFVVTLKLKINISPIGLFPLNFKELKKLISIGLPSAGESFSYSMSQIVIMAFINTIGNNGVISNNLELLSAPAAKTYASMIVLITYLFVNASSQGMQILLGRLIGAGENELANKLVWKTLIVSIIVSEIMATLFALSSGFVIGLLTKDKDIISLCSKILYIEIALELGRAINIVMVRALQTTGDVMFPTTIAIIFCWLVATLFSYILGIHFNMGLVGVWISMAADELLRAIIFIFRWKSGKWKTMNIVEA
jgi:putative MATE family efflux protein